MTDDPAPGSPGVQPSPRRPRVARDGSLALWLVAAIVVAFAHRWVADSVWVMVHLVLLGALTHAALVWSEHFSHTLLRARVQTRDERRQDVRTLTLAAGALLALVGVPADAWPLVAVGVTLVIVALGWHGVHLWRTMRRALTLPEAGHYPIVSHIMIDAERGAHGILEVTD